MKYQFKVTDYEGNTVVFTLQEESLTSLLHTLELFLTAAGFSFKGNLQIVEENDENN
jgi:hypothetical protein